MRDINKNYDDFMDFVGESFESIVKIAANPAVSDVFRNNKAVMTLVKPLCKEHKDDVAVIMAAHKGVSVDEFKAGFNTAELIKSVISILKNKQIIGLFRSAEQKTDATSSGSALENEPIKK